MGRVGVGAWLALVWLLAPGPWLHAAPEEDPSEDADDDIPVVGRPADLPFSGASGQFRVTAGADPTALEAETPLTFTVRVQATGPVRRPPRRIDLRRVSAFAERFYVEDPADDTRHPGPTTWEFLYTLKPRDVAVTEVPGLPFVFYNPAIRPADKAFQTLFTDPIPLQVRPHEVLAVPLEGPESAFEVRAGPGVLARQQPWQPPGLAGLLALVLAPPLACLAWYACWLRLYPDAARRSRRRRSRAARLALGRLRGTGDLPPPERPARAAGIAARYLHERLDLAPAEPTPAEAAGHLRRKGLSDDLADQAAAFFRACDEARFLPVPDPAGPDLTEAAAQLILAVEAETCPPAGC